MPEVDLGSVRGPQGVQGETGPQGPQGIQGKTGPAGPAGPQGEQGERGPQGLQGPAGAKGEKGDKGDTGATGATGAQGPKGDTGPAGPQGPAGTTDASKITTGTLAVARGGTGYTGTPSILVNLAGTSGASPYQASPRPGVTGTLPISKGGTGATTAAQALANLGAMSKDPTSIWLAPDNTGGLINFGDENENGVAYVFLRETKDDQLEIHASELAFTGMSRASPNPLPVNQGGTGKTTALTAADIQAGTFPTTGIYAASGTDYATARVRNVKFSATDLTAGSSSLPSGSICLVYE